MQEYWLESWVPFFSEPISGALAGKKAFTRFQELTKLDKVSRGTEFGQTLSGILSIL